MRSRPPLTLASKLVRDLAPLVGLLILACDAPPLESPKAGVTQETDIRVEQVPHNKVDVLFLIDNSPSMEPMANELRNHFSQFFTVFQKLADAGTLADMHIGVITSDMGAGTNGSPPGCDPAPGLQPWQGGRLQLRGQAADPGCPAPMNHNWIDYQFGANGATNLPGGHSVDSLVSTFTCMASVGAKGCGFEHQLEAAYAALKNDIPENRMFLRDDALLAVVFVTNEDDGSAPPMTDIWTDDARKYASYGPHDTYRQTHFGIECNGSLAPNDAATLSSCVPADNNMQSMVGSEYDVQRYIDLFGKAKALGGVKKNPEDVILVALDAPDNGGNIQIVLADPNAATYPDYSKSACSKVDTSNIKDPCAPLLQHTCQNKVQPGFFGDPGIRLNTVIRKAAAKHSQISSICGDDPSKSPDYTAALQGVAGLIRDQIGNGCIVSPLTDPTHPECAVENVTVNDDGTTVSTPLQQCTGSNTPCWVIEKKDACVTQGVPGGLGVTVNRGNAPPSIDTYARVACSTVAQ